MEVQQQEHLINNRMFKVLLGFLLLCCSSISLAQEKEIIWCDSVKLSWSDYEVKNTKHKESAMSFIDLRYEGKVYDEKIKIKVYAQFSPKKSWVKPGSSQKLLNHEQLHFDIVELYARKLRKMIVETRLKPKSMNRKVSKFYNKILEQKNKCQDIYDKETNYSRNEAMQKEWSEKIDSKLDELKEYSSIMVIKSY